MNLDSESLRVLIVDDEEWNVELLMEVLLEKGFIVDYSSSAEEAIVNLREKWRDRDKILYDILISDFYMGDGDGQEFFWMVEGYLGSDPLHCHVKGFNSFIEAKKSPYCYINLMEILENCFVNYTEYKKFIKDYVEKNPLRILFSGRFNKEMMADPILSEKVRIIQKNPDSLDRRCETAILEYLRSEGFLREYDFLSADYEIRDLKRKPLYYNFYQIDE